MCRRSAVLAVILPSIVAAGCDRGAPGGSEPERVVAYRIRRDR